MISLNVLYQRQMHKNKILRLFQKEGILQCDNHFSNYEQLNLFVTAFRRMCFL